MSQSPPISPAASTKKGVPAWFLAIGGLVLGLAFGYMIGGAGGSSVKLTAHGTTIPVAAKHEKEAQAIMAQAQSVQDKLAGLERDHAALRAQANSSIPLTAIPTEFRRPDVNGTIEQLRAAAGGGGGASSGGAGGDIGFIVADLGAAVRVAPIDTSKPPPDDAAKQRLVQLARLLTWLGAMPGSATTTPADVNKAVVAIQTQAKLTADGKIGPRTWAAIETLVKARRARP